MHASQWNKALTVNIFHNISFFVHHISFNQKINFDIPNVIRAFNIWRKKKWKSKSWSEAKSRAMCGLVQVFTITFCNLHKDNTYAPHAVCGKWRKTPNRNYLPLQLFICLRIGHTHSSAFRSVCTVTSVNLPIAFYRFTVMTHNERWWIECEVHVECIHVIMAHKFIYHIVCIRWL